MEQLGFEILSFYKDASPLKALKSNIMFWYAISAAKEVLMWQNSSLQKRYKFAPNCVILIHFESRLPSKVDPWCVFRAQICLPNRPFTASYIIMYWPAQYYKVHSLWITLLLKASLSTLVDIYPLWCPKAEPKWRSVAASANFWISYTSSMAQLPPSTWGQSGMSVWPPLICSS